jgi:transcriptional regulator with XRE-family HTH domain
MDTFGKRIHRLRKEKRITQLELAEKIGVDFTYISKFENDKTGRPPAESTIRKLAEVLETDAEELILLAQKIPQNLQKTIVEDTLAVDFLRVVPKFSNRDREAVLKIIKRVEDKN